MDFVSSFSGFLNNCLDPGLYLEYRAALFLASYPYQEGEAEFGPIHYGYRW